MSTILRIRTENDAVFAAEVMQAFEEAGITIRSVPRMRSASPVLDIIVELGSAGVFTALYQTLATLLTKDKDREVTIEGRGGTIITIKGHNLPEELKLLGHVSPDLLK
jgi:hypothetical protein